MRKEINSIVRDYAVSHGNSFARSWTALYQSYNSATGTNIFKLSKEQNKKPLDVIEQAGNLETLLILAENLLAA